MLCLSKKKKKKKMNETQTFSENKIALERIFQFVETYKIFS